MKRRELWGSGLVVAAAVCAWADTRIDEAYWAAARAGMLLYAGVPADSIAAWFRITALIAGGTGLLLLLQALIGRIPGKVSRRTIGWTTAAAAAAAAPFIAVILLFAYMSAFGIGDTVKVTAADGQSVLVTQDGFDGDSVDIYTEHDDLHYRRARSAPEISGWPRVKDQNCTLNTVGDELRLICGGKNLVVDQEESTR